MNTDTCQKEIVHWRCVFILCILTCTCFMCRLGGGQIHIFWMPWKKGHDENVDTCASCTRSNDIFVGITCRGKHFIIQYRKISYYLYLLKKNKFCVTKGVVGCRKCEHHQLIFERVSVGSLSLYGLFIMKWSKGEETQAGRVSKQASGFKLVTGPFLLSVMLLLGSFLENTK